MSFAEWLMIIGCALVLLGYLGDIAHANVWEDTQQVVVDLNDAAILIVDEWDDLLQISDNFKLEVNTNYIGFTLTFQPEDLWR
jgi:hypothetical protein